MQQGMVGIRDIIKRQTGHCSMEYLERNRASLFPSLSLSSMLMDRDPFKFPYSFCFYYILNILFYLSILASLIIRIFPILFHE